MIAYKQRTGSFAFLLDSEERRLIHNSFNEVCHGLPKRNLENRFSATIHELERVMELFDGQTREYNECRAASGGAYVIDRTPRYSFQCSEGEARLVLAVIKDVMIEMARTEYPTRIGNTVEEADQLISEIEILLEGGLWDPEGIRPPGGGLT